MALTVGQDSTLRFEPLTGVVQFEMRDRAEIVHCMVTEAALRNRAARESVSGLGVEALFHAYWPEIEKLATAQYARGIANPVIRSLDLAPPPPLPKAIPTATGCEGTRA
jgi:hypothetical protein